MASLNKAILIGNLGRDPELRYGQNGKAVAKFSMATQNYGDNAPPEWHQIVCFDKLAEIAGKYLLKGKLVYVEGRIQTRKYQDKENNERYITEIIASNIQMLSPKEDNNQRPSHQNDRGYYGQ